ncbi:hypothetical protein V5O48_019107 [Marasmius crinis-equi]|uniref:Uncharacterized protein n=1 Tax=Marasmius crinis-equi TaxID=585013 RepID=A0ABR3EJA5_9AGAR
MEVIHPDRPTSAGRPARGKTELWLVKIDVNELEENGMEGIEFSAEGSGKRDKEKGQEGEEDKDGEGGEGNATDE